MPGARTRPRRRGRLGILVAGALVALPGCRAGAALAPGTPAAGAGAPAAAGPRFSPGGPEAAEYGAAAGYPVKAIFRPPYFVGNFSQYDQLFESRVVRRAAAPWALGRAPAEPALRYRHGGEERTLDDYLARNPAMGLLIARDDTILVERYQYGRTDRHRFTSFSMAKTVTAMLVGIAIAEGRIRSVDDPAAAHVPELAGTEYGRTSLRHLLEMSSGVRFTENYSGRDDVARLVGETIFQAGPGGPAAVMPYNTRTRPAGTAFSYASVETQVLGLVLRGAVGRPLVEYLQEKLWEPMGAEADATWLVDRAGQEIAYCCLNAVLRDFARLGLVLARDGRRGDRQLVPAAWVRAATTIPEDRGHLRLAWRRAGYGYGYQTWIFPGPRRMFALLGVHGQAMYVDPATRLVMVHTAVRRAPDDANEETVALFQALVESFGAGAR
jgi:CubicO group peptidase (beta-lactamase class C family)